MTRSLLACAAVATLLAACTEPNAPKSLDAGGLAAAKATALVVTWKLPLDDGALALRSDRQFINGAYSDYTGGVCTVETKIFNGDASTSGDATIRTTAPTGRRCGRVFKLFYPDGTSESVASFNNLNKLHNSESYIPAGTTQPRRLILNPGIIGPSRCGRIIFGDNGVVGEGTDMLDVTRVDGHTWEVRSQAPSVDPITNEITTNDRALCESTGEIFAMPVHFVISASADLADPVSP
jgi:hypothetical protein